MQARGGDWFLDASSVNGAGSQAQQAVEGSRAQAEGALSGFQQQQLQARRLYEAVEVAAERLPGPQVRQGCGGMQDRSELGMSASSMECAKQVPTCMTLCWVCAGGHCGVQL